MMNREELVHDIGAKLVEDIGDRIKSWSHIVLAVRTERDELQINGFAYMQDGNHRPVVPKDFDIGDLFLELRDAMEASDKKNPWCACLVRIARNSGEIDFEFEYDNADRWAITPKNVEERAKELTPSNG